jgi:hypothetical protein
MVMFFYRIGPFVRISAIVFKAPLSGLTAREFQYRGYFRGSVLVSGKNKLWLQNPGFSKKYVFYRTKGKIGADVFRPTAATVTIWRIRGTSRRNGL